MDALRLQVIFSGIDRLTAPIRRLQQGSRGLSKEIAQTQHELAGLKRAQQSIGSYRGAETRLRETAAALDAAKTKTEGLRRQIAATDAPTKKMAADLARAERAELGASAAHERQGASLQALSGKLAAAGIQVENLGDHEDRLAERVRSTSRQLEAQRERADRMERHRSNGEKLKSAGGKTALAGGVITAGVTAPFLAEVKNAMGAAKESAQAIAQVTTANTSMGGKAGFTVDKLSAMAGKLQDLSLFDDDDILRKVTANMMTFGKVTGKNFDLAQQAAVNLSARLGQDLQSSTIQVGKALNDPIKGIAALGRVGIAFDDTQKKQIKRMVEHKNVAGAQAIILAELAREFGGAAAAERAASPDGQMQQNWRTFQETVGAVALKVLPPLILRVSHLLEAFNRLDPSTQTFIIAAIAMVAALGPVLGIVGSLMTIVGGVAAAFSIGFLPAIGIVLAIVAAVALLAYGAYQLYEHWGSVKAFFVGLFTPVVAFFKNVWSQISTAFAEGLGSVLALLLRWDAQILQFLFGAFMTAISTVAAALPGMLGFLGSAALTGLNAVGSILWTGITSLVSWLFSGWGVLFNQLGGNLMSGLINGISGRIGALRDRIIGLGKAAAQWFRGVLGIHSPSRVFAAIGGHMMGGLAIGLDRATDKPLRRVRAAGAGLALAMATSLAGTPAAGAHAHLRASLDPIRRMQTRSADARAMVEPIRRAQAPGADARPPDTPVPVRRVHAAGSELTRAMATSLLVTPPVGNARPTPAAAAAAPAPANHHHHYQITIKGGAGVDMRAQARELMEEIKRLQAHDKGSSYEDDA